MLAVRHARYRSRRTAAGLAVGLFASLLVGGWLPAVPAAAAGCPAAGGGALPALAPPSDDPEYVTFRGRGWGHGVGMSQYGAKGAASLGCSATEILTTYYPGTSVQTRTPDRDVRVGVAWDRTSATVRSGTSSLSWSCGSGCSLTQPPSTTWTVGANGGGVTVQGRTTPRARVALGSDGDGRTASVNGGSGYDHGVLELAHDGARVDVLVELDLEEYVHGIAEIPASWPTESLRTQAIAARSYAQRRLGGSYGDCQCNVKDTTASQVYTGGGYDHRWVAAVDATRRRVVTHGGSIADTVYSSSHGGHSASSAFVWGSSHGYLQPVDDSRWEAASGNPLSRWSVAIDRDVLGSRLGIGRITSATVNDPTGPGSPPRVGNPSWGYGGVTFVGASGSRTVSGEYMRGVLGSYGQLASSLFTVSFPVGDAQPEPTPSPEPEPTPSPEPTTEPTEVETPTQAPTGTPSEPASEETESTEPPDESTTPDDAPVEPAVTEDPTEPATTVVTEEPSPSESDGPAVVSDQAVAVAGTAGTTLADHQPAPDEPAEVDPVDPAPEVPARDTAGSPFERRSEDPAPVPAFDGSHRDLDFAALYARQPPMEDPGDPVASSDEPPPGDPDPTPMALDEAEAVVLPLEIPWWERLPIDVRQLAAAGASLAALAVVGGWRLRRRSPRSAMPVITE